MPQIVEDPQVKHMKSLVTVAGAGETDAPVTLVNHPVLYDGETARSAPGRRSRSARRPQEVLTELGLGRGRDRGPRLRQGNQAARKTDCKRQSGAKPAMSEFYVKPGDSVTFAKTVGETDIYLFAGITGDFAVNHVNEQYMATLQVRPAHRPRRAADRLCLDLLEPDDREMPRHRRRRDAGVARLRQGALPRAGLHRRHLERSPTPIIEVDPAKRRSRSDIKVVNQRGELVGVAQHILAWVKDKA